MAAVCATKHTAVPTAKAVCSPDITMRLPSMGWTSDTMPTHSDVTVTVHQSALSVLQIRLPKSAGDALMSQDAPKNGAMLFQLATSAGRSVHAGVLDFSAAPGTVAVPEHLIRNLWGLTTCDGQCHGDVIVSYKKLPKGTCHHHCLLAFQFSCCSIPDSISKICQLLHRPSAQDVHI